MTRVLLALAAAVFVTGCGRISDSRREFTFEMTSIRVESQPGCNSDTVSCASVDITLPRFAELDTMVQISINEQIAAVLSGTLDERSPKDLRQLASDFISDFNAFVKENPNFRLGWYYDARVRPLIATDTLISLQIDSEVFTGGAHGSHATQFVNVEPMRGTPYLLDALLRPGYQDILTQLALEDFTRQRGYAEDSTGVSEEELETPFALNDNYGFRKEGIVFFYNTYEMGSYAEGPMEILIPYERLRGWIR